MQSAAIQIKIEQIIRKLDVYKVENRKQPFFCINRITSLLLFVLTLFSFLLIFFLLKIVDFEKYTAMKLRFFLDFSKLTGS